MAKKDKKNLEPAPSKDDPKIVARVEAMMEPDAKKPEAVKEKAEEPQTAPEITELPVPDEPLKIKILSENVERKETAFTAPPLDTSESEAPTEANDQIQAEDTDAAKEGDNSAEVENGEKDSLPEDKQSTGLIISEDIKISEVKEDAVTSAAVSDIMKSDSDELIKSEDEKLLAAFQPSDKKKPKGRIKRFFVDLWKNPRKRKAVIFGFIIAVFIVGAVPSSRYFMLNTFGVRVSASVKVIDESTLQPLKNVNVSLHGKTVKTDKNGNATLDKIKQGNSELKIERRAFASLTKQVTIGWGSNPLGEEKLRPTGTQYAFDIRDYVTNGPVDKAEAISDNVSAFSNEKGELLLTLENPNDEIMVKITSPGKRTENLKINGDSKEVHKVLMVPGKKHTYVSKRSGKYDVYAAYIDGKDEAVVLEATGNEREDIALLPHPTENLVAVVSTREGIRNKDGFLLSTLDIINLADKKLETVTTAERVQLTSWFGDRLVYVRTVSGASASNPQRNRLMAYHYKDNTNNELAASNYFNDILTVGDRIYVAPSAAYQPENAVFFSIKPDGSDKKTIMNSEVWNIFRKNFDTMHIATPSNWYDYKLNNGKLDKLSGQPANAQTINYRNSPNGKKTLWVDSRDGKGTILISDISKDTELKEKTLTSQSGLKNPVFWLTNEMIIYRINNSNETADYVISKDGGDPKKIVDVTDTNTSDRWYYY